MYRKRRILPESATFRNGSTITRQRARARTSRGGVPLRECLRTVFTAAECNCGPAGKRKAGGERTGPYFEYGRGFLPSDLRIRPPTPPPDVYRQFYIDFPLNTDAPTIRTGPVRVYNFTTARVCVPGPGRGETIENRAISRHATTFSLSRTFKSPFAPSLGVRLRRFNGLPRGFTIVQFVFIH